MLSESICQKLFITIARGCRVTTGKCHALLENTATVFQLQKLTVSYRGNALFKEITLSLKAGQILVMMGPSGCGKSTVLAAIAGSLSADFSIAGDIILLRKSLLGLPIEQRKIGIQFQEDLLFPHLNVAGNLLFALAQGDRQQRMIEVREALASAGMQGFELRDVSTLSGGQKARVSLLRTLLSKPKLLLLDEPFSRLDDKLRQGFREFVFAQVRKMNIPVILVTHNLQDCLNQQFYNLESGAFEVLS